MKVARPRPPVTESQGAPLVVGLRDGIHLASIRESPKPPSAFTISAAIMT